MAGYVIPAGQRDMTRVEQARQPAADAGHRNRPRQRRGQAARRARFLPARSSSSAISHTARLAKILLEKQVYPDPNLRTYDDASWTMGMMSHAEVKEINDKAVLDVPVTPINEKTIEIAGTVTGTGPLFAVAHYGSNNMITLRYRLKDLKVQAAEKEFKQGDGHLPGRLVHRRAAMRAKVKSAVEALGLTAVALAGGAGRCAMHDLDLPRLAIYSTWGSTQDVGWVRYAFDKFEVPYDLIYKERVREGDLKSAYDVIVIPQPGRQRQSGWSSTSNRAARRSRTSESDQFKNLGMYGESDDITGGMGIEGVAEIDKFVKAGGVLVTLGDRELFSGRVRPGAESGRGANVGPVLLTGRDHRRRDPAAGESDFLRLRQEDRCRCATRVGRC